MGTFDTTMIYGCIENEFRSEMIFHNADIEMKRALQLKDPILFISSLDDMVRFIYELMNENS